MKIIGLERGEQKRIDEGAREILILRTVLNPINYSYFLSKQSMGDFHYKIIVASQFNRDI